MDTINPINTISTVGASVKVTYITSFMKVSYTKIFFMKVMKV